MRIFIAFLLLFAISGPPAANAAEPVIAAAPDWIAPVPIPEVDPGRKGVPVQPLLVSSQTRYGEPRSEYFVEIATAVQQPEALTSVGTVTIPWQPDKSDLIVHKVHILRDGKVIDLLAKGQTFTVLRRENNLETAMLDGVLTAVLQPERLAVGDILSVAFTLRTKPSAVPFLNENFVHLMPGVRTSRVYIREIWPQKSPFRWRATQAMGQPRLTKTKLGNELILDVQNVEGPRPPADAPARYALPASLEVSEYRGWEDISRIFHPVYQDTSSIGPDSPLREEIRRIEASAADPRARTMAALRLVQDKVRYLALMMGDGSHVPASADQTWSRRFGDCKGKTALLLGLLHGLGVEAEPVLVSTAFGDSLHERLPLVRLFDHVIVRARIDGRSYWLDGTRSGDRRLDDLSSSSFGWGLPVSKDGSALEKLPLDPPPLPLVETKITYDASKGFFGSTPTSGSIIWRGDFATMLRLGLGQVGEAEFRKRIRSFASDIPEGDDIQIELKPDEEAGTFSVAFKGEQEIDWFGSSSGRGVSFKFDNETIAWSPKFERQESEGKDAPFQLPFPVHLTYEETILLPNGGSGFILEGKNFDRSVAGTQISRALSLAGGKAVARSVFRRLKSEVPAAEAATSKMDLRQISEDVALVRAPAGYKLSEAEKHAIGAKEPNDAQGYTQRGYDLLQNGELKKALSDFDQAAKLAPEWSLPVANRSIVLLHQGKLDEAESALRKATALDPDDSVVHQGFGLLHSARDKPMEAVAAFTRALELEPDNHFNHFERAAAHQQLGQFAEARADLDTILKQDPNNSAALRESARLHAWTGQEEAAVAALDKLTSLHAEDSFVIGFRAELLKRFGREAEARAVFAKAVAAADQNAKEDPAMAEALLRQRRYLLAESGETEKALAEITTALAKLRDNAALLSERCWVRATANVELEKALVDCDRALDFDPENSAVADNRALVNLRLNRLDQAIADASAAISWSPKIAKSYYVRGIAKARKGDREGGEKDLATARRLLYDIDAIYEGYGLGPERP